MFRFAIVFFALLTMPLRANLGDTVAECVARYGKPIGFTEANAQFPFGTLGFAAADYTLVVFLLGTKEVGARVSKQNKSAFTPAEMQNIMAADTAGLQWISTPSADPTCLTWTRGDKATVLYDKQKYVLIFTSPEMANALHQPPPAKPTVKPVAPPGASP